MGSSSVPEGQCHHWTASVQRVWKRQRLRGHSPSSPFLSSYRGTQEGTVSSFGHAGVGCLWGNVCGDFSQETSQEDTMLTGARGYWDFHSSHTGSLKHLLTCMWACMSSAGHTMHVCRCTWTCVHVESWCNLRCDPSGTSHIFFGSLTGVQPARQAVLAALWVPGICPCLPPQYQDQRCMPYAWVFWFGVCVFLSFCLSFCLCVSVLR